MGKIAELKIDRFDGGIENDSRDPRENTCRVVSNFDIITNPRKMTPYRSSEDGDSGASTSKKQNFTVALRTGTTYALYALGIKSGTDTAEVLYMDFSSFGGNTWTVPSANQSASGTTHFNLFVFYRNKTTNSDFIYGARSNRYIWAFSPSGTAWQDIALDLTSFTNIAQGLVHSKDDILYVPYDNKIAKKNGGSLSTDNWTTIALTLPSHLYITSISEYGNHLAIATAPLSGVGNSRVFLWDRNESTTILSESIDWGSGLLKIIEELDGVLIGISITGGNTFTNYQQRATFRYLNGNQAIKFKILESDNQIATLQVPIAKQKVDNRLYFMMLLGLNEAIRDGLWSIGLSNGQWVLAQEQTTNNNTALASADTLLSFIVVEEYRFIAYKASSVFAVSKTDDGVTAFAHNAIRETKIFDGGDSSLKKKLIGITIHTEPLPANGSIVVKYKMDNEISFTTILTHDTDGEVSKSAINIESSGVALPEWKEIQFRIESAGGALTKGAEITGFSFKWEVTGKRNYE